MQNNNLWDIYDNYRTARLNVKYYSCRLERIEFINLIFEVMIAIAAPGSVAAGAWFLKTKEGAVVWGVVSSIAALAGFVKPFFKAGYKIKFFEQTLSGYRALEFDLYEIVLKINSEQDYSAASRKLFDAAIKKKKILVTSPPENSQDEKLIAKFYDEVIMEIPTATLFQQKDTENNGNKQTAAKTNSATKTGAPTKPPAAARSRRHR